MYTQCPRCRTVFGVREEQLAARAGMVRCGRCRNVFQADVALFESPPRQGGLPRQEPSFEAPLPEPIAPEEVPETTVAARHWPWAVASLTLLVALAGQILYANRAQILSDPEWRAPLVGLCQPLGCQVSGPENMDRMALRRATVTADPRYQDALRVSFTLLNRAGAPQPYPRVELSLLGAEGQVLARRAFGPKAYGRDPEGVLTPNVADRVHFGVTEPPAAAGGLSYELRLFPRDTHVP